MRIAMIGAGYVGLVTAACLAQIGHRVMCHDSDERKITALKSGRIPIFEPGLAELVATNIAAGRLGFSDRLDEAAQGASVVFIAVGTQAMIECGFYYDSVGRPMAARAQSETLLACLRR